ncbi:MAG: SIS domain-containing protein [Clostridia bacterium]|nr:SIS domain-containing protein [Clostridia bacterium]
MNEIITEHISRYPSLAPIAEEIQGAVDTILTCYRSGGKLLLCGNGGSAADSAHIVGELMKSFKFRRAIDSSLAEKLRSLGDDGAYLAEKLEGALPAVALTEASALNSAYANDNDPAAVYAQQVNGLGREGDILLTLTTSGNSRNCLLAAVAAKAKGMCVIAFTGEGGGKIASLANVLIAVPECETYRVQELHLPVYHAICAAVEKEIFG